MFFKPACLAVVLSVCAAPAKATLFDLVYDTNGAAAGGVLEAVIDGTLQGDGNTVSVNAILDFATFDGVALPSLPAVESFVGAALGSGGFSGTVTLDGTLLDIIAGTDGNFDEGFAFSAGTGIGFEAFEDAFLSAGPIIGDRQDPFVAGDYSLTAQPASAVPVPASLGFLLAGVGVLLARGRSMR